MKFKPHFLLAFLILFTACKTNVITGKKTYNFMSNKQLFPMAFKQYDVFLKEHTVITNTPESQQIKDIGARIAAAAQKYFEYKGAARLLQDYAWEYNLVEDPLVNAWCMPGGKIVFYTGILPIAKNPSGIAVIMGHEVAHALAEHGGQRISAGLTQQGLGLVLNKTTENQPEKKRKAILAAYGVGSSVGVMLPFSRKHETEADKIGLELAAIAGFDVTEAPKLWERMQAQGGSKPPEILSTHPANQTRIQNLRDWGSGALALAKKINQKAP
jgi:predicted Zn-dependent protease